jgi:polyhydroxyalkanoate synthesis regulator phasin
MSEEDVSRIARYREAAKLAAEVGRARAEEILRELVRTGESQRGDAQDWLDDFFAKSKERTEGLIALVRSEVTRQLAQVGLKDPTEIAKLLDWVRARVRSGDDGLLAQAKQEGQRVEQAVTSTGVRKAGASGSTTTARSSSDAKSSPRRAASGGSRARTSANVSKSASATRSRASSGASTAKRTAARKAPAARKSSA